MARRLNRTIKTIAVPAIALLLLTAAIAQDQAIDQTSVDLSRYSGVARASQELVITAPIDGLLGRITIQEGDRVLADQEVAWMDDRVQRAVVEVANLQAQNRAPLTSAQESAKFYEIELEFAMDLFKKDAANQREVRLAQVQLAQANAEVMNAQARIKEFAATLALEKRRLEQLHIETPFEGSVMEIVAEPGASLRVADPILRIAKLDPLEVKLPLPASLFTSLIVGETYTLNASSPVDQTLSARLTRRANEIDPASDTFIAVFEIPNPEQSIPAGVRVSLAGLDTQVKPIQTNNE